MRILALTNLYPNPVQPHRASFNRHQFRLLGGQHPIRVIAPTLWTDELDIARKHGLRMPRGRSVVNDGIVVDHPRYWYTPKLMRGLYGRFYLQSVKSTFRRVVAEFAPDIVFAPWAYPDGWAAAHLAHDCGLPVVIQVHGSDIRQLDAFAARTDGTRQAVTAADGVITVSEDLARRVVALGARPDAVRTIVDGVDKAVFHPGDRGQAQRQLGLDANTRHLLFVGNLVPVKGVDVLLRACAQLGPATDCNWRLHLVGEGKGRGALMALAQSLGLADRVSFHGSIAHERLPDWFRAADLFVLPSRSEGIPNVLLEASACGTPYIASAVGGIPEIARLGASVLVQSEDPLALSQAIAGALRQAPPTPAATPRDRSDAAADVAAFLSHVLERHRTQGPLSRSRVA